MKGDRPVLINFLLKTFNLRKGEGIPTFFLMTYLGVTWFGTTLAAAIATSMLLNEIGASSLPYIFAGISLFSIFSSSIYTLALKKLGPLKTYRWIWLAALFFILGCNGLIRSGLKPGGIPLGVFIQYMGFFIILGLDFLNFSNYLQIYFNPVQKKRLFAFICSASKLGGALGGFATGFLLEWTSGVNTLLIWGLCYLLGWGILFILEKITTSTHSLTEGPRIRIKKISFFQECFQGVRLLLSNPFLGFLALIIGLDICTGSMMVFQFNEGFGQTFTGKPEALASFYGNFTAGANLLALVLQMFFAPKIISTLGVGNTNFIYPLGSLLILMIAFFHWTFPVMVLLAFHKDFLTNLLHIPNRFMFYNAIAPDKRDFFLSFLEGIWTPLVSLVFGLILIVYTTFAPQFFPLLQKGFAHSFAIFGILLFVIYLYGALRLKNYYQESLLKIILQKDILHRIKNFQWTQEEAEGFDKKEFYPDFCEYFPRKNPGDLARQFSQIEPSKRRDLLFGRPDLIPYFTPTWDQPSTGIQPDSWLDIRKNLERETDFFPFYLSRKGEKNLPLETMEFFLQNRPPVGKTQFLKSIVSVLEKDLPTYSQTVQMVFCELTAFHKIKLKLESGIFLLSKFPFFPPKGQISILRGLSHTPDKELTKNLFSLFGKVSPILQVELNQTVRKHLQVHNGYEMALEHYKKVQPGIVARTHWFELFQSFPKGSGFNQINNSISALIELEKSRFIRAFYFYKILANECHPQSPLLKTLKEDLLEWEVFFLNLFSDQFDKSSLKVIEKALFDPKSPLKSEAIELLSSTGKKSLNELLTPFLEASTPEQLSAIEFKNFSGPHLSPDEILSEFLAGEDGWIKACTLIEIARKEKRQFLSQVKSLASQVGVGVQDLFTQEMALDCLKKWGEPEGVSC